MYLATQQRISNLKNKHGLYSSGARIEKSEQMEIQDPKMSNWVTVRRQVRGKSVREVSPELKNPNKYAWWHDFSDIIADVALLQ